MDEPSYNKQQGDLYPFKLEGELSTKEQEEIAKITAFCGLIKEESISPKSSLPRILFLKSQRKNTQFNIDGTYLDSTAAKGLVQILISKAHNQYLKAKVIKQCSNPEDAPGVLGLECEIITGSSIDEKVGKDYVQIPNKVRLAYRNLPSQDGLDLSSL